MNLKSKQASRNISVHQAYPNWQNTTQGPGSKRHADSISAKYSPHYSQMQK